MSPLNAAASIAHREPTVLAEPVANVDEERPLKKRAFPIGGDEETRTPDPLHAKQVLYQLSYIPKFFPIALRSGPCIVS